MEYGSTHSLPRSLLLLFRLFTRKQSRNVNDLLSNNTGYLTMQRRPLSVQIKIKASGVEAKSVRAGGPEVQHSVQSKLNKSGEGPSAPRSKLAEWRTRVARGRARYLNTGCFASRCRTWHLCRIASRNCLVCLFSPPRNRRPTLISLTSLYLLHTALMHQNSVH